MDANWKEAFERLTRIEVGIEDLKTTKLDHEDRLRTVEKRQWFLAGVAAVAGTLLGKLGLHIPLTW